MRRQPFFTFLPFKKAIGFFTFRFSLFL